MPTKKKPALRELPKIPKELLEQFGGGLMTAEAIEDASAAFKKALIERALNAELGHHLGYPPGAQRPADEKTSVMAKAARRF
jgi:transposase-like protein